MPGFGVEPRRGAIGGAINRRGARENQDKGTHARRRIAVCGRMSDHSAPSRRAELRPSAAALLRWWSEAGIDAVTTEAPRDRFAEAAGEERARRAGAAPVRTGEAQGPAVARPVAPTASRPPVNRPAGGGTPAPLFATTAAGDVAASEARDQARSAQSLDALREALAAFEGCNLRATARTLVFGDGDPNADLMLVGEAPGRDEDAAGVPFVGRSGQLLNRMLAAIGVERDRVRVTNTVPWRPPGNRTPTPLETEACLPFLLRHIELVRPRVLVCLGSPAMKALLRSEDGIMRLRGRWQVFTTPDGREIPATAMLHPAYLLRQPSQKRLAWRDLVALKERLDQPG